MALTKRINTSYTLKTINVSDTVTMDTSLVTITGNLIVLGSQASLSTTNTTIFDNVITLNAGLSPGIAPTLNAGIEVDRGTLANVQLRWNETVRAWQVTNDGTTYSNIATIASGLSPSTTSLTAISQDTAPVLGGNLDVQNYQIYSSTSSYIRLNDNVAIATTTVAPPAVPGNVVVYTSTSGGSQSGVYVNNGVDPVSELTTQTAALKYAIIFG
jgi:hypothetical protein